MTTPRDGIDRGGIVGSVEIVDCVDRSYSNWFFGPIGFILKDPQPIDFIPMKGKLSLFEVDHCQMFIDAEMGCGHCPDEDACMGLSTIHEEE